MSADDYHLYVGRALAAAPGMSRAGAEAVRRQAATLPQARCLNVGREGVRMLAPGGNRR